MTKITNNQIQNFIDKYNAGKSIYQISKETNVNQVTIKYWLTKKNIKTKNNYPKKGGFNEKEKNEIIRLYIEEKRGAKYIGLLFNRADTVITYWLNKWKIPKNSRSEISKKIREIYGPTKGFSGKKHKSESKKQISDSGFIAWKDEDRKPKIGKSRTYLTKHGKVLGSYEVAYLEKLIEFNENLPKIVNKRYKTPYGTYMPDFEFEDRFIEIKSKFTYNVAMGKQPTNNGLFTDKQWKKIQWLSENIKKVEVVIINKDDGKKYFENAKINGFILN